MDISLIIKVAGIGLLISILNMLLEKTDRKDWATFTTLAGSEPDNVSSKLGVFMYFNELEVGMTIDISPAFIKKKKIYLEYL